MVDHHVAERAHDGDRDHDDHPQDDRAHRATAAAREPQHSRQRTRAHGGILGLVRRSSAVVPASVRWQPQVSAARTFAATTEPFARPATRGPTAFISGPMDRIVGASPLAAATLATSSATISSNSASLSAAGR